MKRPKPHIPLQFILNPLPRPHKIAHILRVHNPKLRRGREEDIAYVLDERALLALPHVEFVEDPAVGLAQVEDVPEYALDEGVERWGVDYGGRGEAEGFYE